MVEPKFQLVSKYNNDNDLQEITAEGKYTLLVTTARAKHEGAFFLGAVRWFNEDDDSDRSRAISVSSQVATCLKEAEERNCNFVAPSGSDQSQSNTVTYSVDLTPVSPQTLEVGKQYILEVVWSYTSAPLKADNAPAGQDSVQYGSPMDPKSGSKVLFRAVSDSSDFNWLPKFSGTPSTTASSTDSANTSVHGVLPEQTGGGAGNGSSAGTKSDALQSKETGAPNGASNNALGGVSGGGLSAGAKAGIAVGAVLGVLAIVSLIFLCLRRRKTTLKTAGGYYGDTPGSSNDLREKEAGVGIAAIPVSASPTSGGHHAHNRDAAMLGRGNSGRVVDGASLERGDVGGHATPVAGLGAASVARKPIGSRGVNDVEPAGREGAMSSQSRVLSDEETARWEEEERRLDEDIAEAERRRLAQ